MSANPQYKDELIRKNIKGSVVSYFASKGFGFIRADDKDIRDDIFVYFNQIVPSQDIKDKTFLKLTQYQEVTFDLYITNRGPVAKNVVAGRIMTELFKKIGH